MKNKVYVIFGAGKAGRDLASIFPTRIAYIVDNDSEKWGTIFHGILIQNPDQLLRENKDNLRIFIASMYFDQIHTQLLAMGFEEHKQFWNINQYYGLLEKVNLLDVIDAEANNISHEIFNSSTFFERQQMIYKLQNDLVERQQNMRVLLMADSATLQDERVQAVIYGLKTFFKLHISICNKGLPATQEEWNSFVNYYKKLEYHKFLCIENDMSQIRDNQNRITYLDIKDMPTISDKKVWLDRLFCITDRLNYNFKKISVIVPNFNYEKFICRRLRSIIEQQYPIYEIIFLDDCSTDDSVKVAQGLLNEYNGLTQININSVNSGSVFKQWKKGIELAQGDYIWIAEADDYASPIMLSKLMSAFLEDQMVLSFCDSILVDGNGEWQGFYSDAHVQYANDSEVKGFFEEIYNGKDFIMKYLSIRNSIPNASAVVIRKDAISPDCLENLSAFKACGDWYFYISALIKGKVACYTLPMNFFNRHGNAVTVSTDKPDLEREMSIISQLLIDYRKTR